MATSKRQRILETLRARLQAIKIASGFQTDLGDHVYLGVLPRLGPDDERHALAIGVGDELVSDRQMEKVVYSLPVEIHIVTLADTVEPWLLVEAGIADVKAAIELADRRLDNLAMNHIQRAPTRTREQESGSLVIGAIVPYLVPLTELWGHPEE
jgi:hypothetical protein